MKINEISYKWNGRLTKRTKTDLIVIHHAAAKKCTAQDVHSWHLARNWSGIGYHFLVRKDGTIYRGRPEDVVGAHASNYNSKSIGICFEGDFMVETMSKSQLKSGKELVAYLKDKYKITNVKGHRDLMSTSCPGTKFPFAEISKSTKDEGGLTVTQYEELKKLLESQKPAIFNKVDEVPEWGRPTIEKLIANGCLQGSADGLNLSMDMLRVFVILDRSGVFK